MRAYVFALAVALSFATCAALAVGAAAEEGCVKTRTALRPVNGAVSVFHDIDPSEPSANVFVEAPGVFADVTVDTTCVRP